MMHFIFALHVDGEYCFTCLLDRCEVQPKTMEEYSRMYPDVPIIFQGKVYFNGEVVVQRVEYSWFEFRNGARSEIPIDSDKVEKIKATPAARFLDTYSNGRTYYRIFGNAYWIEESDGTSFEINKYMPNYGSFCKRNVETFSV